MPIGCSQSNILPLQPLDPSNPDVTASQVVFDQLTQRFAVVKDGVRLPGSPDHAWDDLRLALYWKAFVFASEVQFNDVNINLAHFSSRDFDNTVTRRHHRVVLRLFRVTSHAWGTKHVWGLPSMLGGVVALLDISY